MTGSQDMHEAVRAWFETWGRHVAAVDFESARALFDPSVVGFGTFKDVVHGLDALESGQWRSIWPAIEGFHFDLDSLQVLPSPDGRMAVALITWDSRGIAQDGSRFPRPGRATVVLRRDDDGAWKGLHTHLSVFPAEQKTTFGDETG